MPKQSAEGVVAALLAATTQADAEAAMSRRKRLIAAHRMDPDQTSEAELVIVLAAQFRWEVIEGIGRVRRLQVHSRIPLPEPKVAASASSSISIELIDRRLKALASRDDVEARHEREWLIGKRLEFYHG